MDGNQSEQHYFLSSKMPTSNIITPAQYPCTVISSNKTSNYTIVPNTIIAANNNVAIGNYQNNTKFPNISIDNNAMKIAQVPTYSNLTQTDQEYKLFIAKTKKSNYKRNNNNKTNETNVTGDNITPNQLTFLVQEVLPAQLPDNHPTSSISNINKAQVPSAIISNPEMIPPKQNIANETRDTITEVIQEVLRKAISKEAHDDVFLSVIKARENNQNVTDNDNSIDVVISPNLSNSSDSIIINYQNESQIKSENVNLTNQFHSPNNCQIIQKSNSQIDTSQLNISSSPKLPNKRRNNSNISKVTNKKQKLSNESNLSLQRCNQTNINKFTVPIFRKLVHEPEIKNICPELIPVGCRIKLKNRCYNLAQLHDNSIKYRRKPFTLPKPNPYLIKSVPKNSQLNHNDFIFQNLNAIIPDGALLTSKESDDYMDFIVPPSPGYVSVTDSSTDSNNCTYSGPQLDMLKPPKRTQSPSLIVYHPPASPLSTNYLKFESQSSNSSQQKITTDSQSLLKINGISKIQISHQSSQLGDNDDNSIPNNAQIDSETGEVVNKIQENKIKDKLLVTFTLNPSDDVEKTVKSITDMLGIEYGSCGFKLTTSGGEICVDKNRIDSKIKSELGITPNNSINSNLVVNPSATTPSSACSSYCIDNISSKQEAATPLYSEKIYKSSSLLSHNSHQSKCSNCDKTLSSDISNNKSNSVSKVFCDDYCQKQYNSDDKPEFKEQYLFIGDDVRERNVVIQGSYSKLKQMSKKSVALTHDRFQMMKKKPSFNNNNSNSSPPKPTFFKINRGKKYLLYQNSSSPILKNSKNESIISESQYAQLSKSTNLVLRDKKLRDKRTCCLCKSESDDTEQRLGRLIFVRKDSWAHTTCILWCNKVYETQCGSLNNVQESLELARKTCCSVCNNYGAGISCYNPKCSTNYHVACALTNGCSFYSDRTMYCDLHALRDFGPPLNNLTIDRRVYVTNDEAVHIEDAINDEDHHYLFRMGSLVICNIGQLFAYQIHSGNFHNLNYVYPVGFKSVRIYWSYRKLNSRCKYICEILMKNPKSDYTKPLFRITVHEKGDEDEVFESDDCTDVWKQVLDKCIELRKANGIVNLFTEHIKGEEMYGLTDPHVLRAIESLPGLENVHDYAFKFGKIQLFSRMPLPINISGSIRTEPFRRISRFQHSLKSVIQQSPNFAKHLSSCNLKLENSLLSSRSIMINKWQQYRRLKQEAHLNVVLRRSKVQGLGLFAAHDIEKGTMIIEYIGQLIRNEVANRREKDYQSRGQGIYMFRLNSDIVIDATKTGNLARYINHSCDPNCYTEHLEFDKESHIVIISKRKIERGEELSYDYKFDLDDGSDDKIPCLCGARNCRRWMN